MIDYGEVKFDTYDLERWGLAQEKSAKINLADDARQFLIDKWRQYPPIKAKDFTPPWYTKEHPLRRCYGISKIVNNGYILRAPMNITVRNFCISPFGQEHTPNFPFEQGDVGNVIKFHTPWMIKSDEPLDLIVMEPAYHFKSQIALRIQPGILSAHKRVSYEGYKKRAKFKDEKEWTDMEDWEKDPFGEELNPLFIAKATKPEDGDIDDLIIWREGYPMIQMIPARS